MSRLFLPSLPFLGCYLVGGMYYVISNRCLQLLPKQFPYSSSYSVGSNHSVDSFFFIVALSYYPVITRDRATTIFQFSSNGVDATRSEGVSGCFPATELAKFLPCFWWWIYRVFALLLPTKLGGWCPLVAFFRGSCAFHLVRSDRVRLIG